MPAIPIESLKVGDILHDVHRVQAGNVAASIDGHWEVRVTAIADDHTWIELSWNGNRPERHRSVPSGYKRHPKEWIQGSLFGGRSCGICSRTEQNGHAPDCDHPRAVAARKKAAKAVKAGA